MSTNSIFMKGRLFGDSYRAVDLWEFRRELTLTKRLIKIAEKYVAEKETHSADLDCSQINGHENKSVS